MLLKLILIYCTVTVKTLSSYPVALIIIIYSLFWNVVFDGVTLPGIFVVLLGE